MVRNDQTGYEMTNDVWFTELTEEFRMVIFPHHSTTPTFFPFFLELQRAGDFETKISLHELKYFTDFYDVKLI